jgi:hypothetical protein
MIPKPTIKKKSSLNISKHHLFFCQSYWKFHKVTFWEGKGLILGSPFEEILNSLVVLKIEQF